MLTLGYDVQILQHDCSLKPDIFLDKMQIAEGTTYYLILQDITSKWEIQFWNE
jgi:hypothetical protein